MPTVSKKRKKLDELRAQAKTPQTAEEAIKLLKKAKTVKFDETVEVHFRLGINPKLNDQQIRSTVNLPGGTGKTVRVAVVAKGEKVAEAEAAGADVVGSEELVAKIGEGFLEFDKLVATPDAMAMLSKLGKVLGPRGLMPNPKDGTVTVDVAKAIKELKAGKVSFRAEKDGGLVQMPIGKLSFEDERLIQNLSSVVEVINKVKPATVKGTYIKAVYLSSTMGPGVKLDPLRLQDLVKGSGAAND
ncbi:MAG TPA: 50S ribosomal protein L1 [Planktothrix sp.]|jgi:large subunit ribosomal protein L1